MFCGFFGAVFCYGCLYKCRAVEGEYCIVCDNKSFGGITHIQCLKRHCPTALFCCFEYEGLVQECIKRSKYMDKEFSVLRQLSKEGVKEAKKSGVYFENFVVVPIPLSKKKEHDRGFNQAEVIAKEVSRGFWLSIDTSILIRIKDTRVQYGIGRLGRMGNLRNAFKASKKARGKKILLVDDICTTGSTFLSASRTLYAVGAKEVRCFSLSKKM